ncbi:polysaccharide deacetylase family protein [uncultured Streptococcus sp.]|uniref:polysaccharide deacetylase family protein n=1 Tax=uncultured Streptococcus sp. TaxID=83427 RepID=UPI0027DDC27D|nr:polysaccharide deacetylase family protein [uncultured Streptococcus sp.]
MEKRRQDKKHRHPLVIVNIMLLFACILAVIFLVVTAKQKHFDLSIKGIQSALQQTSSEQAKTKKSTTSTSKESQQTSSASHASKTKTTWTKQTDPVKVPILMYHAIHVMDASESASANLIVDPTTFESHIKRLVDEGYYFLSPEEAYRALTKNELPAKKVVWLTFDDGNEDFYTIAYPIMKKYGVKATNNVITGFVQEGRNSNLTIDQMLEMKANGMSFQSHTVNHPDLSTKSADSQASEMSGAKSFLDEKLSQDTIAIAYPSGRYNSDTLTQAASSYKLAVTTNEGIGEASDGLLSLDRVRILPTTTADDLISTISN